MSKVYLAGPVSHTTWVNAVSWRKDVKGVLRDSNIDCLDPTRHGLIQDDDIITHLCMNDVKNSDAILVNFLDMDRISIGTILEIGWASALDKPVVLVVDEEKSFDYGIFQYLTRLRADNMEDGLEYIKTVLG